MSRRRRERGAALVVTLIFTAAMAAAAVAFLAGRQTDALTMRGQLQAVEAQAMLEAALQQTVALVVNRKPRQRVPSQISWQFGDVAVRVRIEGESGKVDLNKADQTMLEGLAIAVGLPEERAAAIADAVVDWRDENQLKLNNGAEDRDYGGEGQATSGAADRPFAHPSELRYVLPVDPVTAALLVPHVTIYSGQEQPEPRKASAVVRRALEIARGIARTKDQADHNDQSDQTDSAQTTDGTGDTPRAAGGFGSDSGSSGLGGRAAGERAADGSRLKRREAGRLASNGGEASTLSKLDDPNERRRAGASADGAAGGQGAGAEDDTSGAQTLSLDVRFRNGYEAAAKAVVAFGAGGGGEEPYVVLDWTPIVGTGSGGP